MPDTAVTLWHDREPVLLNGLCQYCTYTFNFAYTTWLTYEVPWYRSVRYPELTELLSSGCPACEILSRGIRWHSSPQKNRVNQVPDMGPCNGKILIESVVIQTDSRWDLRLPANENGPYLCDLVIKYGDHDEYGFSVPVRIYGNTKTDHVIKDDHATPKRIRGRVPGDVCLSTGNKTAMKEYLDDCSKHHSLCQSKHDGELPSRLLDLGTGCKGVRLVATDGIPTGTAYATLSHVWGKPQTTAPFLVTTQETVSLNGGFIEFEALPKSFQDAVEVTRALDLRYVWIDSLCIIQDSADDWHREAPRMAKIYSNAYVTIVATSASSAHDGFLKRSAPELPPAKIPSNTPPSLYHEPTMDLEEAYWNNRGWTFQERILSRRLIHFTKDLIFIECWSGDWSEDNRLPGSFYSRMPWLGGKNRYSENPKDVLSSWYAIVESYTFRSLTKEQDKLHALAGIMDRVSEITGFTPVAGLWKEDLANGLSWITRSSGLWGRRLASPQGPSWSWASWDGPIHFNSRPGDPYTKPGTVCFDVLHIEPIQSPKAILIADTKSTMHLDMENDGAGCLDASEIHEALGDDLIAFPLVHHATSNLTTSFRLISSATGGWQENPADYSRNPLSAKDVLNV
ncbi:hypothetical protein PG985_002500 [Apiospora marii]|uniref:uncharacterized protein n=1 Tax=Apiospora marii TaxID=335849 RepID=UPI00312CD8F2